MQTNMGPNPNPKLCWLACRPTWEAISGDFASLLASEEQHAKEEADVVGFRHSLGI